MPHIEGEETAVECHSIRQKKVKWLDIKQVMQMTSLKKSRIYYLVQTRQIPHSKVGQSLRFREDLIIDWMEEKNRQ